MAAAGYHKESWKELARVAKKLSKNFSMESSVPGSIEAAWGLADNAGPAHARAAVGIAASWRHARCQLPAIKVARRRAGSWPGGFRYRFA
jgi:hypothetical protein